MTDYKPIKTPWKRRWIQIRIQALPVIVFAGLVGAIIYLWEQELTPTHLVGEVFAVVSEVSSPEAGIVAEMTKRLFEPVRAGDVIARIEPVPAAQVEARLRVLQAEMELTRAGGFGALLDQERNLLNKQDLYHDWLAARARLAVLTINARQSQLDVNRADQLYAARSLSESDWERLRAVRDALMAEKEETTRLVASLERAVSEFAVPSAEDEGVADVRDRIQTAALNLQEAQLRQLEAEIAAIEVRAPITGIVTALHLMPGTFSAAGRPLAVIRPVHAEHIIGYVRQPAGFIPQVGDSIEVITRGGQRASGLASVLSVGPQFEPLGPAFQRPFATSEERGLPVLISLPDDLSVRPGEFVDLRLLTSGF
jgi:multidrug resistance efflux pump